MKYVLYEGQNGDMLFTREELVKANPSLLTPFENKTPTLTIEAEDDNDAITKLNGHMMMRGAQKQA
jgi:hypothetical protein